MVLFAFKSVSQLCRSRFWWDVGVHYITHAVGEDILPTEKINW